MRDTHTLTKKHKNLILSNTRFKLDTLLGHALKTTFRLLMVLP